MNKQNGLLTSAFTIAAAGTVVLGIVRGIQKRSFRPFLKTISDSSPALQIPPAAQGRITGRDTQNIAQPLQKMMNKQGQ